MLSAEKIHGINEIINDFDIHKLKVFSSDGSIIHSTRSDEIGQINRHDYFGMLSQEAICSRLSRKNQTSAEGHPLNVDVAEVYVPIMDPVFVGRPGNLL
ncbi:MAG: hypothetical protein R2864_14135 [Syntrophotaleaceae bacterium]